MNTCLCQTLQGMYNGPLWECALWHCAHVGLCTLHMWHSATVGWHRGTVHMWEWVCADIHRVWEEVGWQLRVIGLRWNLESGCIIRDPRITLLTSAA